MSKPLFTTLSIVTLLTGCTKVPNDLMKPRAETLRIREAQSRSFNTESDKQLLRASLSVLQDMGYTVKESSSDYGVLTATKDASAVSGAQVALSLALVVLSGKATPIDKVQQISATVVILDKNETGKSSARTTFQRVVTRSDNTRYAEVIIDENVYREFYEKLDKSLFLEANNT